MKKMTLYKKNRINYIVLYDYFSVVMAKGGAFFGRFFLLIQIYVISNTLLCVLNKIIPFSRESDIFVVG